MGLVSRHDKQQFTPNVRVFGGGYFFSTPAKTQPSFRSSPEYDEKAWELCVRNGKGRTLFWNEENYLNHWTNGGSYGLAT